MQSSTEQPEVADNLLHPAIGRTQRLFAGAFIFVILTTILVGPGPTLPESLGRGASSTSAGQSDSLAYRSPSQCVYYPTSSIRIGILYDLSTGAQVYADSWRSLLTGYEYDASLLSLQQLMSNPDLACDFDVIVVDHSCGGDGGNAIDLQEAETLAALAQSLILLGGARGAIDRISNYEGEAGRISITSVIQKANGEAEHSIYTVPYPIPETGSGAPHSIEIFNQGVTLESYPENVVKNLNTLAIIVGAAKPVIGGLYTSHGGAGRIQWWSFKDPSTLNINGHHLVINTIEWIGGHTTLGLLIDSLESLESLDPSESTYWTGGYADYFEPLISASFYAYASLQMTGGLAVIDSSALIDWLVTYCYRPIEGYFSSPNRYLSPTSWSGTTETGMALLMVSRLGALDEINLTRTSNYLKACQITDGFARYPRDTSKSLTNTYWALIGLNITGALDDINKTAVTNYILSCQNLNSEDSANYGGFADRPGRISFARYTQMALASLKLLGSLGSISQTLVEQWLMSGYVTSKGAFYDEHTFHERYMMNYGTGYSIASLSILGRLQNVDQVSIANYLTSVQFVDGGWSGANATDEPIDEIADCYPVILGLSLLDRTNAIRNLEGFIRFTMRCLAPAPTYGFSNLPRTLSNLWHTSDIINILDSLGVMDSQQIALLNSSIISSYDPSASRFEWTRYLYPPSSDGYGYVSCEQPYEFTSLQKGRRGVIMTNLAVTSLLTLGSRNWLSTHAQGLWNEISRCEVTAGPSAGFYKGLSTDSPSNLTAGLRYTYHALSCLWALAGFLGYTANFPSHLANATLTINKIMSLYDPLTGFFRDDGYILEPCSSTETTYLALASLSLLNDLRDVDYIKTSEFLQLHLYTDLVDTYYSFRGLQILGRLSTVNAAGLTGFLANCQKPNGVFKSDDIALYRVATTRMAIEILSYYNSTWVDAKQIRLVVSSLEAPPSMSQGSNYLVNLTLIDNHFLLPVEESSIEVRLGAYEFEATEAPSGSGRYSANIAVPIDTMLLGTQSLVLRCSKGTYQTVVTQTDIEILRGEGIIYKTLTETTFSHPGETDYLTTSNTSITASIRALNESQTRIQGADIRFSTNGSLVETGVTDSFGSVTFNWRPLSSGTYIFKIAFEGSSTLNASESEGTFKVDKTQCQLAIDSNYTEPGKLEVGQNLEIRAFLSERSGGKAVAHAGLSFLVFTPSGSRIELGANTGDDGVATISIRVDENGSYSIQSEFKSTDYYLGCVSSTLLISAGPDGSGEGGDDDTNVQEEGSWIGALLSALSSPFGSALVIGSGSLLAVVYFSRAKRQKVKSIGSDVEQRGGSGEFEARLQRRLRRHNR